MTDSVSYGGVNLHLYYKLALKKNNAFCYLQFKIVHYRNKIAAIYGIQTKTMDELSGCNLIPSRFLTYIQKLVRTLYYGLERVVKPSHSRADRNRNLECFFL